MNKSNQTEEVNISEISISKLISLVLAYGVPLLYFLISVSFYLRTYDSAQIKISILQVGGTILSALWVILLILEKRWPFKKSDLTYVAPFIAFFISGIISYAQSNFYDMSFDEFTRRILYIFLGAIIISEFRTELKMQRLFRWLIAAAVVAIGYGMIQYFDTRMFPANPHPGIDPFIWRQAFGKRVFSTYGNPNFYGNFLVIITPMLLTVNFKHTKSFVRPFMLMGILGVVVYLVDKMLIGIFGGGTFGMTNLQTGLIAVLTFLAVILIWRSKTIASGLSMFLVGALFINLYATETKGAWMGFGGTIAVTVFLMLVFFSGKLTKKIIVRIISIVTVVLVITATLVGY